MKKRTILITGTSGLIGGLLFKKYRSSGLDVIALEHGVKLDFPNGKGNFRVCKGDITKKNLDLSKEDLEEIRSSVTDIWHCAAKTKFSITCKEGHGVNVQGTKNMLELAKSIEGIRKIGVLSTLYVAGKRTGVIKEEIFKHSSGFVNQYEKSKYDMELAVQNYQKVLPISIYRIGTVIGNSNGVVTQKNAVHQALRLLYGGLVPMLPAKPNTKINLVAENYVLEALYYLFEKKYNPSQVFHIAGRDEEMLAAADFLNTTFDLFRKYNRKWDDKNIAIPPIVDLETFEKLHLSVEKTKNMILKQITSMMSVFVPQLCFPKTFDMTNVNEALSESKTKQVPFADYYPKIVKYCINTW